MSRHTDKMNTWIIPNFSDIDCQEFQREQRRSKLYSMLSIGFVKMAKHLDKLNTWTMLRERRRNFSDKECEEFQRELRRAELTLLLTIGFAKMSTNGEEGTAAYQDTEKWLDRLLKKPDVLLPEEEDDMRRSSSVQIAERVIIVKTMGFKQGHWYKCPNGHVYAIGECGGAMERSRCPECQADIGGSNHQLTEGNAVATEMDGAKHAAWSDQANLANYEHLE